MTMAFPAPRRPARKVVMGGVEIGGGAPVSVQSMTNTRTSDTAATSAQIERLAYAGCQIARVAVPDAASAHGVRINPGNIGSDDRVRAVVDAAAAAGIPLRIGVNAGSLEKDILECDGRPTAEGLAESCMRHLALVEGMGFADVILSIKASDVGMTVEANRIVASECDCPLHLGITEAGTVMSGAVRSAVGLGVLLADGIGDTIRVSLAGPPEDEVLVGRRILSSLGLERGGVTVVACPTCGRTTLDVAAIAEDVERLTSHMRTHMTVAVMGCAVNGPGEAREADVGVAGGGDDVVLFSEGRVTARISAEDALDALMNEIRKRVASE